MGELGSDIVIAEIAVCIEVQDHDVRIFFRYRAKSTQRDQVFAAEHDRELTVT